MGRSPVFHNHVRPVPERLDNKVSLILKNIYNENKCITEYDQDGLIMSNIIKFPFPHIKIVETFRSPPRLDRSCSVYFGVEEYFPQGGSIYDVIGCERYQFNNQYSDNNTFYYDILLLQHIDPQYHLTYCIRTDGEILNIESLASRGHLVSIV
jgi:hypothetical protein